KADHEQLLTWHMYAHLHQPSVNFTVPVKMLGRNQKGPLKRAFYSVLNAFLDSVSAIPLVGSTTSTARPIFRTLPRMIATTRERL
ncbi:hypothetical protein ACC764_36240, partial [Rhizobium ruizarguesonis]